MAGAHTAFVCPDQVTNWNVGSDVHTFVCEANDGGGAALSDDDIAKFAARKTGQWQLPSGCDAGTCTESQKTFLATSVSLVVDASDEDYLLFTSNGIPDHNSCSGPPNSAITAQNYSYRIPRYPTKKAGTPDSTWSATNMGAIGFAINGVPIYNPYDSACCDAGLYELTSLDACYAHPAGTQGNYHYHVWSECLAPCKAESELIGFALDGFPIMGPGINPTTGNMWSQSDMDVCGGREDNGVYKYYTTIDFPYYLQCYRGETGDTTGNVGGFDGSCGLNNSGCTRTNSSGRKRRSSTGDVTQDWINSLFELEEPSDYAKRLMNDSHAKRKRRSLTQLTSDIDAYIALWGSQQAVTKQQFLDNLAFTCNTCHGLR